MDWTDLFGVLVRDLTRLDGCTGDLDSGGFGFKMGFNRLLCDERYFLVCKADPT